MQLIELAAQALAKAQGNTTWDALEPEVQKQFQSSVREVLKALRDPDVVMAEAGAEIIRNVRHAQSEAAHLSDAVNTWRFMIAALLGERG